MPAESLDKMMKNYREKALASRTRFQRFVDIFAMVPIATYFIVMFTGVFTTGARLTSLDLTSRFFVMFSSSNFLAGFLQSILIHLWFIPTTPAMWNPSLLTPAAISVLVGFALFIVYFISRGLAYKQIFYTDLGFLAFFLLGLTLMFVVPSLFTTLYYYYPATLVFLLLAIPSLLSIVAKKPFTFQH